MPIGSYACVPYLAQQLIQAAPRRVLDLGIGFGGNGAAVRQWLDLGVQPWRTFLVGVEAWADYRNPLWDLYNLVVVDTIENYFARPNDTYEAVLLTDVIEHFEKPLGQRVLQRAQRCVAPGGLLLVSTPAAFFDQAAVYGNPYERHCSSWSEAEFQQLGFHTQLVGDKSWYCGEQVLAIYRV